MRQELNSNHFKLVHMHMDSVEEFFFNPFILGFRKPKILNKYLKNGVSLADVRPD